MTSGRHVQTIAAVALALAAAAPALAQDKLEAWVGGGAVMPTGSLGAHFDTGWQLAGGLGWKLGQALALRLDYGYSDQRPYGHSFPVGVVSGSHKVQSLELDLRWTVDPGGTAPIYLFGGPGLYDSETAITRLQDYEPGPGICDPWFQVCIAGPAPAEQVLGSRSSTDVGFNVGAGVEVPIHGALRFFVEGRWRYVRGGEYGLPGTTPSRATASYFPLTLGVRF